jgi:uncharacterized membrane protein YgaE (UPF0421/DUF939 family)
VAYTSFLTPTIGVGSLLAFAVVLVLRGFLVPRSTVQQMRDDKDAQIAVWKSAYETSQRDHAIKDKQITALMEATRTTNHVIAAMSEATGLSERSRHAVAPSED